MAIPLLGKKFGRLKVISDGHRIPLKSGKSVAAVKCQCDCGAIKIISRYPLIKGTTKSCGCLQREKASQMNVKRNHIHGKSETPTYQAWLRMRNRCLNKNNQDFALYGGRGIKVCERWNVYMHFLIDMGEKPDGLSLDRINGNGNYEPSNCRWATHITQMNNVNRNRILTIDGKKITMADAARKYKIPYYRLRSRINCLKWSDEEAVGLVNRIHPNIKTS